MSTVTNDADAPPPEPCAACKYQRRQCSSNCQLAPYFPPDKHRQFANAHRLFGACNILRTLRKVGPSQRAEAMRTIIFESDMWAQVPDGGCYHLIQTLDQLYRHLTDELALTNHHIQRHRSLNQHQQQEKAENTVDDDVKPIMVESGPGGTAARRMHYFVASLSLRLLLLLCSVTGLVLLLTGSGRERFPPPFVSLLDAEFGHSPALVCFLVVVSVACLYSVVTVLVSIPSLPPRLLYLLNLCTNHQLLCGLKISDKHQDLASHDHDMEEGLKKQEWLGEDENKEEVRENVRG